jgi:hypothetical protein
MMVPLVATTSAAGITFMTTAEVSKWHHLYPDMSATGPAWPDSPDLPHTPEPDMTFYSPLIAAGTASTFTLDSFGPAEHLRGLAARKRPLS